MPFVTRLARSFFARLAAACVLTAAAFSPAFAASYLDPGLKDLTAEQKAPVANPQPVQLLFQFKTKGAANPRATKVLKKEVTGAVQASGAFSEVSDGPTANGAILSVTLENIPQEGAASKGFATGLTFGLKGTAVTDFYVCTVEYLPSPDGAKIVKTANHAIHTTLGLVSTPPEGEKAKNIMAAVETMTRQIVGNAVNSVAADPAFAGVTAVAAEPEAAPVAAPAVEEAPAPEQPAAPAAPAEPVA